MSGGIVESVVGALVGGVVSSILSPKKKDAPAPPAPPVAEKPKEMPVADDEKQRRAKRQSIAAQTSRAGRASTILSNYGDEGDTLG